MEIAGAYRIDDAGNIRFDIGGYDVERTLVIDPILEFSSYVGGVEDDTISDVALDADGNIYVVGSTVSPGLQPTTPWTPSSKSGELSRRTDSSPSSIQPARRSFT